MRKEIKINNIAWEEVAGDNYEKTILLFITDLCNLNCNYCFNKGNLRSNKTSTSGIMDLGYIETIIKNNPSVNKYDIMGGEPLLHKQFDDIVKLLEKYNKKIGLYTNGYLLDRLGTDYKRFKINISFQTIVSSDKSMKPISEISQHIKKYQEIYPFKLVILLNSFNKLQLKEMVSYVETEFQKITSITIGTTRNESDYWNDSFSYVVPFTEYAEIIQEFLDSYTGRLDVDVFTKGYLYTPKMSTNQPNQSGRFKCVYSNGKYTPSLYGIAKGELLEFDIQKPIDFYVQKEYLVEGRDWTDKIRLINKQKQ